MARSRRVGRGTLAAVVASLLVATTGAVSAQAAEAYAAPVVTWTELHAGGSFEVTGSGCLFPSGNAGPVAPGVFGPDGSLLPFVVMSTNGEPDGHWSAQIRTSVTTPPGSTLEVRCLVDGAPLNYPSVPLTILPPLPTPSLTPGYVEPGAPVTLAGAECLPLAGQTSPFSGLATVRATLWNSEKLTVATFPDPVPVTADGTWSTTLDVPADLPAGTYTAVAACDTGNARTVTYPDARLHVGDPSTWTTWTTDATDPLSPGDEFVVRVVGCPSVAPDARPEARLADNGGFAHSSDAILEEPAIPGDEYVLGVTVLPGTAPGLYRLLGICVIDQASWITPIGSYEVVGGAPTPPPAPLVSPDPLVAGDPVSVSGTGCVLPDGPGQVLAIVHLVDAAGHDAVYAAHPVAPDGTWTVSTTVPADTVPGAYTVTSSCVRLRTDPLGHDVTLDYPDVPVTVRARTPNVAPGSVVDGGAVDVSGVGCPPGGPLSSALVLVTVSADDDGRTIVSAWATVDPSGAWSALLTIPDGTAAGSYSIGSSCGRPGGATFDYPPVPLTVTPPAPVVTPGSVAPGGTVTVTGAGCAGTVDAVLVDPQGRPVGTPPRTAPGSGADWTRSIGVPADAAAGTYSVQATCHWPGGGFSYPAVPLTVVPGPLVTPNPTVIGHTASVSGTACFPELNQNQLWWVGVVLRDPSGVATTVVSNLLAGPDGVWTATFTVPRDAVPGAYVVEATCHGVGAPSFDYPPAALTVVAPAPVVTSVPVVAGGSLTLTYAGCWRTPSLTYPMVFDAGHNRIDGLSTVRRGSDVWTAEVSDMSGPPGPGTYTVVMRCELDGGVTYDSPPATFVVVAATPPTPVRSTYSVTGSTSLGGVPVTLSGTSAITVDPSGHLSGDVTIADTTVRYVLYGFLPVRVTYGFTGGTLSGTQGASGISATLAFDVRVKHISVAGVLPLTVGPLCTASPVAPPALTTTQATASQYRLAGSYRLKRSTGCAGLALLVDQLAGTTNPIAMTLTRTP